MMNKLKNTKAGWWKAAAFLPVLAFASVVFSNCGEKSFPENSFKVKNKSYELSRCIIADESMRNMSKFDIDLTYGDISQHDLDDSTKIKQMIWLSVASKEPGKLVDGEYKSSDINVSKRPAMTFSGSVFIGTKEMYIEDGSFTLNKDSNRVVINFNLTVKGGLKVKGSYSGLYEIGYWSGKNAELSERLDQQHLTIEIKQDGYYIDGQRSSFDQVVERLKTRGRNDDGTASFGFYIDGGIMFSGERLKELRELNKLKPVSPLLYNDFDQAPEFPGGNKAMIEWIKNNRVYPKSALENRIQGIERVAFLVNKEGIVEKPQISMGVDSSIDAEALKLVAKMPKWKPAMKNGKPVDSYQEVFIDYRLN